MKKYALYGILMFFFALLLHACGSSQSAAEKAQLASDIKKAVEMSDFTFEATYAYPTGYRSVYLSPSYDVRVTPDTVKAYLPYYGRAYRAPMDPREGGFQFASTDFTYSYGPGSRRGSWMAHITILDLDRPVTFSFDIWENGSSRLVVNDFNRQSISFQGDFRIREEKEL